MRTNVAGSSLRLLLVPTLILLAVACTDPESPEQPPVITPAEQPLAIMPANQILQIPRSLQLSTRGGRNADTVAWESSDQAIASVSASGLVTARFPGSATITARLGKLDSAMITLTVRATGIAVGPSPVIVALQGTQALTGEVVDADGAVLSGVPVIWSTGNASIAIVDERAGVVTGMATGTTT
ncbi:MAG: Ig-like domain-containing protein, partial [Longimicrobiales bacterium]